MTNAKDEPRRILLIRPSALGDVCRSVPLLVALRRRWPSARIDWLVQDSFAEAISHHPDLIAHGGGPLLFPRKRFSKWWRPSVAPDFCRWLGGLRAARYDLVIDAQGLFRSGFFAWCTGARHRVGFANAAELGWLGYSERVRVAGAREMHTVDRMMQLITGATGERGEPTSLSIGASAMRLHTGAEDRRWARSLVTADGSDISLPLVVIAPTSRWPGKLWPVDRYAAVAEGLLRDETLSIGAIAIVGAASEVNQCGPLINLAERDPRVLNLLGKTSIGKLMAVIERSSLVIASDSAALHMGVGFERPILGLFGPTRVDLVGPYGRAQDVVQHIGPEDRLDHKDESCGRELMARITTDEVLAAATARLRMASASRGN